MRWLCWFRHEWVSLTPGAAQMQRAGSGAPRDRICNRCGKTDLRLQRYLAAMERVRELSADIEPDTTTTSLVRRIEELPEPAPISQQLAELILAGMQRRIIVIRKPKKENIN